MLEVTIHGFSNIPELNSDPTPVRCVSQPSTVDLNSQSQCVL